MIVYEGSEDDSVVDPNTDSYTTDGLTCTRIVETSQREISFLIKLTQMDGHRLIFRASMNIPFFVTRDGPTLIIGIHYYFKCLILRDSVIY